MNHDYPNLGIGNESVTVDAFGIVLATITTLTHHFGSSLNTVSMNWRTGQVV